MTGPDATAGVPGQPPVPNQLPGRERWVPGAFTRHVEDGVLELRGTCPDRYEGGPGVAHGGWTAALLDELLGSCANLTPPLALTVRLEVVYAKPVPLGRPLLCRASVQNDEGRRLIVGGEVRLAGPDTLLASATATFVRVDADHYVRTEQWLADELDGPAG